MKTEFSLAALAQQGAADAQAILRSCVHCGFCNATCPTYGLLGEEPDGPRGRIYLIKDMLEHPDQPPTATHVQHVDRCLSCLSCMTTCPSGVQYAHLIDHARAYVTRRYRGRPWRDRALRRLLGGVVPRPGLFRAMLATSGPMLWFSRKVLKHAAPMRLRVMLELSKPPQPPSQMDQPQTHPAQGERRMRVILAPGCVQRTLRPSINEATIRLLTRLGAEVVVAEGAGCCGALNHHLGQEAKAHRWMHANIVAWERAASAHGPIDAIVVNASGCGGTVKEYGWALRHEPAWAERAAWVGSLARDVSEVIAQLGVPATARPPRPLTVTYHTPCSLTHGLKLADVPRALLEQAGFSLAIPADNHLCCGSAGVYNILQPQIAKSLKQRKAAALNAAAGGVTATANIGCLEHLADDLTAPIVHVVELLDWATGGPPPDELAKAR